MGGRMRRRGGGDRGAVEGREAGEREGGVEVCAIAQGEVREQMEWEGVGGGRAGVVAV